MARIRSIKPEFWRSPSTAAASPRARLLYIAMWNWADDYGVGEWTPRELLGFAFPNDLEVTNAEFQSLCTEVAACYGTIFYTVRGRRFYCIPAWDEHQKNERRAQGKYPRPNDEEASPDLAFSESAENRGTSVRVSGDTGAGTGEQGNREQGKKEIYAHPTGARMDALFDQFWDAWPLKKGKKDARIAFEKVVKSGVTLEQILAGVQNYRREIGPTPDWSKVKYPQGWLNAARWEDEPAPAPMNEPVALRSPEAPEDCGRHKWAVDGTCLFCNTRRVVT